MAKWTIAAVMVGLIAGTAGAATDGGGSATLGGDASRPLTSRAGRPSYVTGGWVCPPGFVWRNAGKQDWLCVDAGEARRIALENRYAAANWVDGNDGAGTCRPGLVRRDAFKEDPVCVEPARRERVHEMNLALFDLR